MKTKVLSLIALVLIGATNLSAQTKTEEFKVYGNCGMCETRIEKAVNDVDGVSAAEWNKETKMLEVSFDGTKTDVHKLQMEVAKIGHDTDMHKASDEVYNQLPGCCKYERSEAKKNTTSHECHNH
ncbi:MAG: cation transporter [Bacteroidales bacterium]|jgi:mercuric ion binding protein|nr:cation transporter [Bacteroidales bacterium]